MFKSSHRPDHGTHILLVVCTGRRCPRQGWLSDHLIVHHQWEHSILCACKSSHGPNGKIADVLASTHACTTANASVNYRGCVLQKISHGPMGRWLTCPNRLSSNRDMYVPDTPANFPSPRWENALLTCPFLFSSCTMGAASNYQAGVRAICA